MRIILPYAIANNACKKTIWLFATGINIAIGTAICPAQDDQGFAIHTYFGWFLAE
jgi:hypothetical protein